MAVIRVSRHRPHADHEAFCNRCGAGDFLAEFVAHPGPALENAVDLRLVQGVELAAALRRLVQQARDQGQHAENPRAMGALWNVVELPADVAALEETPEITRFLLDAGAA